MPTSLTVKNAVLWKMFFPKLAQFLHKIHCEKIKTKQGEKESLQNQAKTNKKLSNEKYSFNNKDFTI